MDTASLVDKIKTSKQENGDYYENGILMCGKCRTAKEIITEVDFGDGSKPHRLAISCECMKAADAEAEKQVLAENFSAKIRKMWEVDNITLKSQIEGTFARDDQQNSEKSNVCRRYVEHWDELRTENCGILFYGTVGTGKTFYAGAIANALLERQVPVAVTNFPRLLNLLQGTQDKQGLLDRLDKYKLLVIDDLGVERDSSFAAEQVFNVVDARARSRLPLIVTTNLTMSELKDPGSMQYSRIYDRILELCPIRLKLVGKSRRMGISTARRDKALEILGMKMADN